jgi:Tfp pilus assembly protein PilF
MAGPTWDDSAAQQGPARAPLGQRLLRAALLTVIVLAAFYPVLGHEFVAWDDDVAIYNNTDFLPPRPATLEHYWTSPYLSFYVPVTYTVWWLLAHVAVHASAASGGGYVLSAWPYHAASLVAHVGSAVLAYLALARLVRNDWAAWFGAAVYAVHPLHAESVAWASTMYTPLSGCFALAATWAYLRFSDAHFGASVEVSRSVGGRRPRPAEAHHEPRRRAWPWYALFVLAYALSLLTKPTIILLPVALWVLEVLLRRRRWRAVAVWLAPALLVGAIPIAIATRVAQVPFGIDVPVGIRPLIAGQALAFYLLKAVIPWPLSPDYGVSVQWLQQGGQVLLYSGWLAPVIIAAVALWAWLRRGWRWPLAALGVFVLVLTPVLGFSTFDFQRYSTVADRYAYFALIAPAMLLAATLARGRRSPALGYVVAGVVVVVFGVAANAQSRQWRDSDRFFAFAESRNPDSVMVHVRAMRVLEAQGRPAADGLEHYRAVAAAFPDSPRVLAQLGTACMQRGLWDEAARSYAQAGQFWRNDPRVFRSLGVALAQGGHPKEALDAFAYALRLDPRDADAHLNAAIVLAALGRRDEARGHFEATIQLGGDAATARRALAQLNATPSPSSPPAPPSR